MASDAMEIGWVVALRGAPECVSLYRGPAAEERARGSLVPLAEMGDYWIVYPIRIESIPVPPEVTP